MSIVEKMARAIKVEAVKLFEQYGGILTTDYINGDACWKPAATSALTATGLTEARLAGLAAAEKLADEQHEVYMKAAGWYRSEHSGAWRLGAIPDIETHNGFVAKANAAHSIRGAIRSAMLAAKEG